MSEHSPESWRWPIVLSHYDMTSALQEKEWAAIHLTLDQQAAGYKWWYRDAQQTLSRLMSPVLDALDVVTARRDLRRKVWLVLLSKMNETGQSFWGFEPEAWEEMVQTETMPQEREGQRVRRTLLQVAFLLGLIPVQTLDRHFRVKKFALRIFGEDRFYATLETFRSDLLVLGYEPATVQWSLSHPLALVALESRSPYPEDFSLGFLKAMYQHSRVGTRRWVAGRLIHVLHLRGLSPFTVYSEKPKKPVAPARQHRVELAPAPEWEAACQRWLRTSTRQADYKRNIFLRLRVMGRWLTKHHSHVISPEQWDWDLAVAYVAAVETMCIGDYASASRLKVGQPLKANSKASLLTAARVFFLDCQAWGWIRRSFDPIRAFYTPYSVKIAKGPDPKPVEEAFWIKITAAAMNLSEEDRQRSGLQLYPLALLRAVALIWVFGALRSSELRRLRVGCVAPEPIHSVSGTPVHLLTVPPSKNSPAYVKPIDAAAAEALIEWERQRPPVPQLLDDKTHERVDFLLCDEGQCLGPHFLNQTLIPLLCNKAGVPTSDRHGRITSHRARATCASQLANSEAYVPLAAIQQYLGHLSPDSTRYYVALSPTKLARSYRHAEYFKRNLRCIEVLLDQEAIRSGATSDGEPWRYVDLGHGYCTDEYFELCKHRMVCAKCAFYVPKASSQAHLLEAREHLQRMVQEIPCTEAELAALADTAQALELAIALIDEPARDGRTPRVIQQDTVVLGDNGRISDGI